MTTRVEMELHAGMRNHSYMYNRDAANQHPMSAITGLNDKLAGMGSVVEMTAFTDAMNAATVDGPAVTVTSPTTRMTTAMWNELAVGKYIIGPEGVKIFRCTAKTETSFSAVCVSVANLRGEKGDKGDTGNTGPKGDAYEITSADYEAIAEIVEDEYTEELASIKNDLRTQTRKVKALTDLLNGQELRFDTEDITGASIDVASGCVADSVLKVSGKSVVVNQLVMLTNNTITRTNTTFVSSENGTITVNSNGLTDDYYTFLSIDASEYIGHKMYIKGCPLGGGVGDGSYYIVGGGGFPFREKGDGYIGIVPSTATSLIISVDVQKCEVSNLVFKPQVVDLTQMFGSGSEPSLSECQKIFTSDYYSYNTGTIVSSQTDSVKVRNKNIWNPSEATWILNTTTQTLRGYSFSPVSVKAGNTYTVHFESSVTEGYICISKELYGSNAGWVFLNGSKTTATITADSDKIYVCRYGNMPSGNLQIELGSTKTDYEPYEVQTITTSFPVLKSAGSVSDYIDLASARPSDNAGKSIVDVVRCVGSVDLGSLSWNYQSASNRFLADVTIDAKFVNTNTSVNAITTKFTVTSSDVAWTDRGTETNVLCFDASNKVRVYGSEYTDATAFKSAMNGVTLLYEKATPTTEELEIPTDLLSAINVEAGGQITFVDHTSTLAMPITTTNEWVVRNEEV